MRVTFWVDMIHHVQKILAGVSKRTVERLCIGQVLFIGIVDFLTGYELSFSVFYLLPIVIAAWYGNRRMGFTVAFLSSVVWLMFDLLTGNPVSHLAIHFWNGGVRLGFFMMVAYLLVVQQTYVSRLAQAVRTDAGTGMLNTTGFFADAQRGWDFGARHGHTTTLSYLDLDNFKAVNDDLGHAAGDAVLRAVAGVFLQSLRATDIAARLGGDEFAVLLPETPLEVGQAVLQRLRESVEILAKQNNWPIRVSVGAVAVSSPYPSLEKAIRAADALMYRSKYGGKNTVVIEAFGEAENSIHNA
jgi:diguanylate cyclase (GGDEF)-like protein